ncbi:centlein-like, partial [Bombina bombina]|uniref:centlein-like n=1 Tax=Bombina bombina TaxID=8345 RepID=UPI00235B05D4
QREKKNKTTSFKQGISMTSLRDRIASLQHKVTVLQRGKRAATESANEFKKAKIELAAELHLAHQRLLISKQMLKKLSLDLTELQREKEYMEQNLEQMKVQLAQFKRSSEVQCPVTSDLSPAVPLTPSKNIDPEMKQLQNKLKPLGKVPCQLENLASWVQA